MYDVLITTQKHKKGEQRNIKIPPFSHSPHSPHSLHSLHSLNYPHIIHIFIEIVIYVSGIVII